MKPNIFILALISIAVAGCSVVRPGQVGVKQRLGKIQPKVKSEGVLFYNPFIAKIIKPNIQTNNLKLNLNLPSKEGLSVKSEISVLYRLDKEKVVNVIRSYGVQYEAIIASIFRSASSDVCAQYLAKDMHSGMRANIENSIKEKMDEVLGESGIIIERILMKSIQLPEGLSRSIEQKLQAEQDAMRMEFVLKQEKLEAQRKVIEAQGDQDAQKILNLGLTPEIIKMKSIEAFEKLANSPNTKVIITNGETPLLIED